MLNKSEFSLLMKIVNKHKWLLDKADALADLIFESCASWDERALIETLLDRFMVVSPDQFIEHVNELVLEVMTIPHIDPKETIVAAMAADSSPDSSQFLVQQLKVKFQENGWGDVRIVNTFGTAFRESKRSGFSRKNVILVDEFVGSGVTASGRAEEIKRQFAEVNQNVQIFVRSVFASVVGEDFLKRSAVDFVATYKVKRGISDFEPEPDRTAKVDMMLELESRLSDTAGSHKLSECSLGYGKTESLFAIMNQNLPNSVFPIFWWPTTQLGLNRQPLFTRWLG
ncbi:hypothetical protein [Herbaspirillum sp. GW103]|uniref:phosphoribosyltransferase-like protein n=1 Tax=Herbaspirillum sp. GW103 TaxID=1175306 RepID=UPI00054E5C7F|nr:hypothetical protein [Herbaspirillum sp. GW103]